MHDSVHDLGIGLLFAAVLVYFLMVVNYQGFSDPLVVILALPATLCGILTMLFITGTTLSDALADGGDHGGGRCLGELHFAGDLRTRAAAWRPECVPGGDRRGGDPGAAGADYGGGHDRRHDPDGDRRRRRGTECGVGARGDQGPFCSATPTTLLIVPYLFALLRKRNDGVPAYGVFEELPNE